MWGSNAQMLNCHGIQFYDITTTKRKFEEELEKVILELSQASPMVDLKEKYSELLFFTNSCLRVEEIY